MDAALIVDMLLFFNDWIHVPADKDNCSSTQSPLGVAAAAYDVMSFYRSVVLTPPPSPPPPCDEFLRSLCDSAVTMTGG